MHSLTEENYLKAIHHLSEGQGEVNVKDLSEHLDIKMPTVTSMMKKLAQKGLVIYQSYKPVKLTKSGLTEAALIIRKHRLTEMFLVEKMAFGWEEVHEIAEQIEHVHAPAFFSKMDELLGHPQIDPHGSPIPDENGRFVRRSLKRLSDSAVGDRFTLEAVVHSEDEFLAFLNKKDLSLGSELQVLTVEPFDKSIQVRYGKRVESFSHKVAERLLGTV